MNKDFVIIVQGGSEYVPQLKEKLEGFNVIFSTWVGDEKKYLDTDVVIYNEKPTYTGPANLNLQKITTINGLKKAKEMGFKRALKLRSDLIPTNMSELFKSLDNEYLNFLCWHCHEVYPNCPGYLIDYLMSGDIDYLIKLWDIEDMNWCAVPEIHLTQQYISKLMSNVNIKYFLDELKSDNDLYWVKHNINLSSYQANTVYDKYKKYDFELNKEHLTLDYTKFLK
jgi:hypothetical protein